MDPALQRQRELFKKRSLSTPAVEKRHTGSNSDNKRAKVDKEGSSGSKHNADSSNGNFSLKAFSGSSGNRFGCLARIVNYMKTRHQRGDTHPLTLEEMLDETKLLDIGMKQKQWLVSEALVNNPKIDLQDGKYAFKPKYELKDKKSLLRLLYKYDQLGLGGILLDDVEEGLPNSATVIKASADQIIFMTRRDKKKVLFYNDKHCQLVVDERFQKLWRSVPVDSVDEEQIDEYFKKHGISFVTGPKRMLPPVHKRKGPGGQKNRRFKTHNVHLEAGVLEEYSREEIQKGLTQKL